MQRNNDGTLPRHAWPGCYPLYYITADGADLCADCANGKNGSEASTEPDTDAQWHIVGQEVHWEGTPQICDHCGALTQSAYGDPEAEQEERAKGGK